MLAAVLLAALVAAARAQNTQLPTCTRELLQTRCRSGDLAPVTAGVCNLWQAPTHVVVFCEVDSNQCLPSAQNGALEGGRCTLNGAVGTCKQRPCVAGTAGTSSGSGANSDWPCVDFFCAIDSSSTGTGSTQCNEGSSCTLQSSTTAGQLNVGICVGGQCRPNPCLDSGCANQCDCLLSANVAGICGFNGECVERNSDNTMNPCAQAGCANQCECQIAGSTMSGICGSNGECVERNDDNTMNPCAQAGCANQCDCALATGAPGICGSNGQCVERNSDPTMNPCSQAGCANQCECQIAGSTVSGICGSNGECVERNDDNTLNPCAQAGCANQCDCALATGAPGICGSNGQCVERNSDPTMNPCSQAGCANQCECQIVGSTVSGICGSNGQCVERNNDNTMNPCAQAGCANQCECSVNGAVGICNANGACEPRQTNEQCQADAENQRCQRSDGSSGVCIGGVCANERCADCPNNGCDCEVESGDGDVVRGQCVELQCVAVDGECREGAQCETDTVAQGMCRQGLCRDERCLACDSAVGQVCECELPNGEKGVCNSRQVCQARSNESECDNNRAGAECITSDNQRGRCSNDAQCVPLNMDQLCEDVGQDCVTPDGAKGRCDENLECREMNGQCSSSTSNEDCVLAIRNRLIDGVCLRGQCVERQCRADGASCEMDDGELGVCRMGRCASSGCQSDAQCNNFGNEDDAEFDPTVFGATPQVRLECRDGKCVEPSRGSNPCANVLCRNNGRCQAIAITDLGLSAAQAAEIEDALLFDQINGVLVRCACDEEHEGVLCEQTIDTNSDCDCKENQVCSPNGECVDQNRKEVCNSSGEDCDCISGERDDNGACVSIVEAMSDEKEDIQRERFSITWARGTSLLEAVANVRALFDEETIASLKVVARKNDAGFVEVIISLGDDVDELDDNTDAALKKAAEEASQRTDVIDVAQIVRENDIESEEEDAFVSDKDAASLAALSAITLVTGTFANLF